MMIIGLKSAGLGNCMFQYTAAKSLAIQNDTIVKFGIINFKKQQIPYKRETKSKIRDFLKSSIGALSINYKIANRIEIEKFKVWVEDSRISSRIEKQIRNITKHYPLSYFLEKGAHEHDSTFLIIKKIHKQKEENKDNIVTNIIKKINLEMMQCLGFIFKISIQII